MRTRAEADSRYSRRSHCMQTYASALLQLVACLAMSPIFCFLAIAPLPSTSEPRTPKFANMRNASEPSATNQFPSAILFTTFTFLKIRTRFMGAQHNASYDTVTNFIFPLAARAQVHQLIDNLPSMVAAFAG